MSDFLISRIKDYIPLTDSESRLVESLFVEELYKKNEVLLQEGRICRKLYFISQGIVRFSRFSDGGEKTFVFKDEGSFFTDHDSFMRKTASKNTITAVTPTNVFSISYENLQVFYNELQYGDRFGRIAVEQFLVIVFNHLSTLYSETPEQRFIKFAIHHKELLQRIPQYYIASHIGISPQSLCRIKKKMLKQKIKPQLLSLSA